MWLITFTQHILIHLHTIITEDYYEFFQEIIWERRKRKFK